MFGGGFALQFRLLCSLRNPIIQKAKDARILYHDIGDYLSSEDKLSNNKEVLFFSSPGYKMDNIIPNEHGDWISQRNDAFLIFIPIGDKEDKNPSTYFVPYYSNGVKTNRDAWCYNSSRKSVLANIKTTISFYNEQKEKYQIAKRKSPLLKVENFIDFDSTKISWDRENRADVFKDVSYKFENDSMRTGQYRPFFKQIMYFNRKMNNCIYQQYKHFPKPGMENTVICVSGVGVTKDFSTLATNVLPDLELIGKSQCFPLYYYEERQNKSKGLFDDEGNMNTFAEMVSVILF